MSSDCEKTVTSNLIQSQMLFVLLEKFGFIIGLQEKLKEINLRSSRDVSLPNVESFEVCV